MRTLPLQLGVALLFLVAPSHCTAACKGNVVVEQANRFPDQLVSQVLDRAERKARQDGYCVEHVDVYDSLGQINSRGMYSLAVEFRGVPVAVLVIQSIPVAKNRSIITSQMRWQRGYDSLFLSYGSRTDVHVEYFDLDDFDASEMDAPEPNGYVGYANRIENAADLAQTSFANGGK